MNKEVRRILLLGVGGFVVLMAGSAALLYYDSIRPTSAVVADGQGVDPLKETLDSNQATAQEISSANRALSPHSIIALSIERFERRIGRYPERLDDLLQPPEDLEPDKTWDGPYINNPQLLIDPWGQAYHYRHPGRHNERGYDLWTVGPDGVNETSDDMGNW